MSIEEIYTKVSAIKTKTYFVIYFCLFEIDVIASRYSARKYWAINVNYYYFLFPAIYELMCRVETELLI